MSRKTKIEAMTTAARDAAIYLEYAADSSYGRQSALARKYRVSKSHVSYVIARGTAGREPRPVGARAAAIRAEFAADTRYGKKAELARKYGVTRAYITALIGDDRGTRRVRRDIAARHAAIRAAFAADPHPGKKAELTREHGLSWGTVSRIIAKEPCTPRVNPATARRDDAIRAEFAADPCYGKRAALGRKYRLSKIRIRQVLGREPDPPDAGQGRIHQRTQEDPWNGPSPAPRRR
jgi:Mor family transcriptional regulator